MGTPVEVLHQRMEHLFYKDLWDVRNRITAESMKSVGASAPLVRPVPVILSGVASLREAARSRRTPISAQSFKIVRSRKRTAPVER